MLLIVLKIVGWLLLLLLLLLAVLLLVPIGVAPCFAGGKFSVGLHILFLHFTLWTNAAQKESRPPKKSKSAKNKQAASPPQEKPLGASGAQKDTGKPPHEEPSKKHGTDADTKPPASKPAPWEGLPFGIGTRIDAAIALAKQDPAALAECALGHLSLFGRGLVRCLSVRHLNVYWTITAEDAADTAVRYGAVMTALNNMMAVLYRHCNVQAERLWLEPDYTGEHMSQRRASCEICSNLALLIWLLLRTLLRVYNEPLFRPQKQQKKKTPHKA